MQLHGSSLHATTAWLQPELSTRSSANELCSAMQDRCLLREVTLAGRGLGHQLAHFRLDALLVSLGLRQSAARAMSTTGIRRSRFSQTATAPAHAL